MGLSEGELDTFKLSLNVQEQGITRCPSWGCLDAATLDCYPFDPVNCRP